MSHDYSHYYVLDAVGEAKRYVTEAIRQAPDIGSGHGPLNHFPRDSV